MELVCAQTKHNPLKQQTYMYIQFRKFKTSEMYITHHNFQKVQFVFMFKEFELYSDFLIMNFIF
jgi:hypothetical protein